MYFVVFLYTIFDSFNVNWQRRQHNLFWIMHLYCNKFVFWRLNQSSKSTYSVCQILYFLCGINWRPGYWGLIVYWSIYKLKTFLGKPPKHWCLLCKLTDSGSLHRPFNFCFKLTGTMVLKHKENLLRSHPGVQRIAFLCAWLVFHRCKLN